MNTQKNTRNSSGQGHKENNKDWADKSKPGHSGKDEHSSHKDDHKPVKKQNMPDSYEADEEPVTEADLDPGKQIQIDDDPEQTRRKIPNMEDGTQRGSGKSMGKDMERSSEKGKRG